jgi:hypothetical protein
MKALVVVCALLALPLGASCSPASPAATAAALYGTREKPLTAERQETLHALAHYVDQTAQGVLEGATSAVRYGTIGGAEEGRFVSSIRAFARSAAAFSRQVDDYAAHPFEVPSQVASLSTGAREISERLRAAQAMASMNGEWDGMNEALGRMSELLAGREVEVPAPWVVPPLAGDRLAEFRRLARDLQASTAEAHETARREAKRYARGEQFLGELGYFASESRDLVRRSESGPVSPQFLGAVVARLYEEARLADRRMRDARTFTEVWDDSGRSITVLGKMATLIRS